MLLLRAARCTSLTRCLCQRCPPSVPRLGGTPAATDAADAVSGAVVAHSRHFAVASGPESTSQEEAIAEKLRGALQSPVDVLVVDTSGGCGSMFQITAVAGDFRGMSVVKQHQLVTRILAEEIATWHGFQLDVKAPPE